MSSQEIEEFFQSDRHPEIAEAYRKAAHMLGGRTGIGRQRSVAFTKLQESFFWVTYIPKAE